MRMLETTRLRYHLRLAGHHVPGSGLGRCLRQRLVVGLLELGPQLPVLEVAPLELPSLVRVVESCLEASSLLLGGDVEEELDDGGALIGEQALEVVDVLIAPLPSVFGSQLTDP